MGGTGHEESYRRLVLKVYECVLRPLDSSQVDAYFLPDYIQHNPAAATGSAGLKAFLDEARRRSPHAEHHVKRTFVDGDHVVCHVHVVVNPGDRGLAVIDIFRIANGRIAEHWDVAQPVPEHTANSNGMF